METLTDVKTAADEWYEFRGEPGKPPYWVARAGRTVTSRIGDDHPTNVTCDSIAEARAEFAEATCDPDGPGAPRIGDTIDAYDYGRPFTVTSVDVRQGQGGWPVFLLGGDHGGAVEVSFATYRILSRPE